MRLSRRNWLGGLALGGGAIGVSGYAVATERHRLDVTRKVITLPERHASISGMKIAVMGDFHHDDFGDDALIRRAVSTINREKVDFVFLVGDYISTDSRAVVPLAEELGNLNSRFGTFGVMGNHDRWHFSPAHQKTLEKAGVRMLVNEAGEFDQFTILGMNSYRRGLPSFSSILGKSFGQKPVILGWHEPDTFATYEEPGIALQVSGHTHGDQICAPFYGPIILPANGKRYPYGLYRRGETSLFVTRGIGTLTLPIRFLCPPELALITLAV